MNPIRHRARRLAVSALYDGAFKMLVDTTKAGSASNVFGFPVGTGTYQFNVSWGDGTGELIAGGGAATISHTYAASGIYVVSIRETRLVNGFPTIYFNNGGDKLKVLDILQWGRNKWLAMNSAFFGCSNMVVSATDGPGANTDAVTTCQTMFRGCTALRPFAPFPTKNVTNLSGFMMLCAAMTENRFIDIGRVTDISSAWYDSGLTSFPANADTKAAQNWTTTFYSCDGLAGYDFPPIDMHSITNGTNCFYLTTPSKASYNSMLDQLANGRGSIPAAAANSVAFRTGAHYDASTGGYDGTAARSYLTGTKSWTITDGGTP